jgi:hypothetical protein
MIGWLVIVVAVVLIRAFIWLCGAIFGSNSSGSTPGHTAGYPTYGAFDVLVYQASPYGGGTWAFCRRHADYYSTMQDIQYLQAYGYMATYVQR